MFSEFDAAVLGKPIGHSRSPLLHNAAYRYLGIDWRYGRFEVDEPDLRGFLESHQDVRGYSLTMPLKSEAFRLCDVLDEAAVQTTAVNTMLPREGGWQGLNTDVPGFVDACSRKGISHLDSVTVLGAGATAHSAIVAAQRLGATRIKVLARRAEAAQELATATDSSAGLLSEGVEAGEFLISTLPGDAAANVFVSADVVGLFDVTYAPWPTSLASTLAHVPVLSGMDLLIAQAVRQVLAMTGVSEDQIEGIYSAMVAAVTDEDLKD